MHRFLTAALAFAAFASPRLPAQEEPAQKETAQKETTQTEAAQTETLPALAEAAPLASPRAPGALKGFTLCLAVRDADQPDPAVRTVHYLARLLESAGARVAVLQHGDRDEAYEQVARDAGAELVLVIGWDATQRALKMPVESADREEAQRLQIKLLGKLTAEQLVQNIGYAAPRPVPKVPYLEVTCVGEADLLAHRDPSHRLFRALQAWWQAEGDAAQKLAEEVTPAKKPAPREPRVNSLWPLDRPPQSQAEVRAFLTNWRRAGLVDKTQVWLDVDVERSPGGWVLRGSTELPLLEDAVRNALASVGIEVSGSLRTLPDARRLKGHLHGVVKAASAQTWSRPGRATGLSGVDPSGQGEETDLVRGEPVWLLDRDGDDLLVHAASGYLGWVRAAAIEYVDEDAFRQALAAADATGETVARRALARLGTPYLFGGRSGNGIDCSGFVAGGWATEGVFLPRDARQQILAGQLVATSQNRLPLEPGDLLFFASGSGRISHVGMSIGGMRFVHATPPEVTVGSLDPSDPLYTSVAERFVLAKRVAR